MTMMRRLLPILLVLGLIVAACGDSGDGSEGGIEGDWAAGSFELTLGDDGSFTFTEPRGTSSGTYTTTADSIRLSVAQSSIATDEFPSGCTGADAYTYSLAGDSLNLSGLEGKCDLSWPPFLNLARR